MASAIKAQYTRAINSLADAFTKLQDRDATLDVSLDGDASEIKRAIQELKTYRLQMLSLLTRFDTLDERWLSYITNLEEESASKEEAVYRAYLEADKGPISARTQAEQLLVTIEIRVSEAQEKLDNATNARAQPAPAVHSTAAQNTEQARPNFVLPRLDLPKFDGTPADYRRFTQSFEKAVHEQALPAVTKLTYLMSSLTGEAQAAVKGFEVSEQNYEVVRTRLRERFGDERLIKNSIFARILALRRPGETYERVVQFVDHVEALLRQAEAYNMTTESEAIRIAIEKALPTWVESHVFQARITEDAWDLTSLRRVLKKIVASGAERGLAPGRHPASNEERITTMFTDAKRFRPDKNARNNMSLQRQEGAGKKSYPWKSYPCVYCGLTDHKPAECKKTTNVKDRAEILRQQNRCFLCARTGHTTSQCRARNCPNCNRRHHSSLCPQKRRADSSSSNKRVNVTAAVTEEKTEIDFVETIAASNHNGQTVPLMTTEVRVRNPITGRTARALGFFDSGANRSYITTSLAATLQLPKSRTTTMQVERFGGDATGVEYTSQDIELLLDDGSAMGLHTLSIDKIVSSLTSTRIPLGMPARVQNIITEKRAPSVLIGSDYFWRLVSKKRSLPVGGFYVIDTLVGPVISGHAPQSNESEAAATTIDKDAVCAINVPKEKDKEVDQEVTEWLRLESVGIQEIDSNDDAEAWHLFQESVKFIGDRFHVSLPLKERDANLPTNEGLATQRLIAWRKHLSNGQNAELLLKVAETLRDWESNQITERVPDEEIDNPIGGRKVYLPYHIILKKGRVVHDASARCKGGQSLNGVLYRGPVMLPNMLGMLLRFRSSAAVALGDISKAFNQLALNDADRDLLRFVVPRDWNRPITKDNIEHWRFRRLNFGLISSSFLLAACLRVLFNHGTSTLESEVLENIYVDNVMTFAATPKEAATKMEFVRDRMQQASMPLHDLVCSDMKIASGWDGFREYYNVLGLKWHVPSDQIEFEIPQIDIENLTKRKILSATASVFDPTGILSPCLLPFKLFIQKLWKGERRWDEKIPAQEVEELKKWTDGPKARFAIPRRVLPDADKDARWELHVFVDASEVAIGACAYLKQAHRDHQPHLLMAKGRVAPLRAATIPRLELTAATFGVRMAKFIAQHVALPISKYTLWSDSQCTIAWIRGDKTDLPAFVQNRVKEIRSAENMTVRYIRTHENPADLATRGCTAAQLAQHQQWWHGPPFLQRQEKDWPKDEVEPVRLSEDKERFKLSDETTLFDEGDIDASKLITLATPAVTESSRSSEATVDPTRFSKWTKLVGTVAAVLWFVRATLARAGRKAKGLLGKTDATSERQDMYRIGELHVIKEIQSRSPPDKVAIQALRLYQDEDGIWRSLGRIDNSEANFDAKRPIFLPKNDHATKLLVEHVHQRTQHSSTTVTLAELRKCFWIPKGRLFVKKIVSQCHGCKRQKAEPFRLPPLPQLPRERVAATTPFENTAVDLAGPFRVRGTSNEVVKTWLLVVTCLVTRAVHIEMLFSLSAEELMRGLRRFISRRGTPKTILSDNGSNFRAAAPLLESWTPDEQDRFCAYATTNKIRWHHIPALSPWNGGAYERMIRIVKESLRRVIGNRLLESEEFRTFVTDAEAIVNSRPITYLSNEDRVLRPADLLQPNTRIGLPSANENDDDIYEETSTPDALNASWLQTLKRIKYFWQLFSEDYLLSLRERGQQGLKQTNRAIRRTPIVGEIVLVHDANLPRGQWKCARIIKLTESSDNRVRSAEIETANGRRTTRSIALLYPLEAHEKGSEQEHNEKSPETDVDDSGTNSQPTSAGANTNRYDLRPRTKKNYVFYVLAILSCLLCSNVNACNGTVAYQEYCVKTGLALYMDTSHVACAEKIDCGNKHLRRHTDPQMAEDRCAPPCQCPLWADGCSFAIGAAVKFEQNHAKMITRLAPQVCFRPSPDCSVAKRRKLHNVMLYNGRRYIIEELNIIKKQDEEPVCAGEGETTGTEQFCERNLCSSNGSRFCLYPRQEKAFLKTPDGEIPIKAWSTESMVIYEGTPPNNTKPTCQNVTMTCNTMGVQIDADNACADFHEICVNTGSSQQCTHFEQLQQPAISQPPPGFLVAVHHFKLTSWQNGKVIQQTELQCEPKDVCELANCVFCWSTYFQPECITYAVLGTVFQGIVICMAITVMALATKRCRTRRRNRPPIRRSPWGTPTRLMERTALLLITFGTFIHPALACGQILSFSAQHRECKVHHTGAITCKFDEETVLTVRAQEEACIFLKDHAQRPVGTLRIQATPIYRCRVTSKSFTRLAELHTMSTRRCPGMGSCVSTTCSTIRANDKLHEFEAVNDHPGITRCSEACSGIGCGCISFRSGCHFSRTYAIPQDDDIYEIFECEWEKAAQIKITLDSKLAKKSWSTILAPGGIDDVEETLHLGLLTITGDHDTTQKTFATVKGHAYALNEVHTEAARLLTCATAEDAKTFKCHLDAKASTCHVADDMVICETTGNSVLRQAVATKQLPQIINGEMHRFSQHGVVIDGNGATTLQVRLDGLEATTQLDVASCHMITAQIEGCFACTPGAVLTYQCTSQFGTRQLAHMECPNGAKASVLCDQTLIKRTTSVSFENGMVDEDCIVRCSGGTDRFRLHGTLSYTPSGSTWTTTAIERTETSTWEELKDYAKLAVVDYLPAIGCGILLVLIAPKILKILIRLLV